MVLKTPYKLEKLTITAYKEDKRTTQVGQPFIAMFNPESYSQNYSSEYITVKAINNDETIKFARSEPSSLTIKLILDGTGCHEVKSDKQNNQSQTVAERIKHLLSIAYTTNGDIHEPNFLYLEWGGGDLKFECRLASLDINYTSFNADGTPLRADLNIKFISDVNVEKQLALKALKSPDLTHIRIVKSGDTLPLLSKSVYGSSSHYLWVAQQNQLDDFRNLIPGQRLFFPPLVT